MRFRVLLVFEFMYMWLNGKNICLYIINLLKVEGVIELKLIRSDSGI